MQKISFLFYFVLLLALQTGIAQQKINTEKSEISFSVTNLGVNTVEGTLEGWEGKVSFDPDDVEAASFKLNFDPETIDTGNGMRDKHLRNKKNFFYTKIYPTISFQSTRVEESDDGQFYKVVGDLTIKETTKSVEIPFKYVEKEDGVKLTGFLAISRIDYGVGNEGTGMIGEEIAIKIVCFIEK